MIYLSLPYLLLKLWVTCTPEYGTKVTCILVKKKNMAACRSSREEAGENNKKRVRGFEPRLLWSKSKRVRGFERQLLWSKWLPARLWTRVRWKKGIGTLSPEHHTFENQKKQRIFAKKITLKVKKVVLQR